MHYVTILFVKFHVCNLPTQNTGFKKHLVVQIHEM